MNAAISTLTSSTTKQLVFGASSLTAAYYAKSNYGTNRGVSQCEGPALTKNPRTSPTVVELRRRMTSIGRFSYKSETLHNPSIPTFFLAISEPDKDRVLDVKEMDEIWKQKRIMDKHDRFRSVVSSRDDRYFVVANSSDDLSDNKMRFRGYANPTFHSSLMYRTDLKKRIEHFLTDEMDLKEKLWEVQMSSGQLGSSGAISKRKSQVIRENFDAENEADLQETVMLFRSHHAMADGVSIASVIGEISDEADEVQDMIHKMVSAHKARRKKAKSRWNIFGKVARMFKLMMNIFRAIIGHALLVLTSTNPFAVIFSKSDLPLGQRSISWCDVCSVEEAKTIAKAIFPGATLNDLFVSCVSSAIAKQLYEHREIMSFNEKKIESIPSHFNIVVPVHLSGGILLPGESLGNRIGAFVSALPTKYLSSSDDTAYSSVKNLEVVSESLRQLKTSPAAYISWAIAKIASEYLPETLTKYLMRSANANAVCVVSNVRVPVEDKLHLNGRPIESMCGFLPLPPGVPIGIVVQSYAGAISLTVTADNRAVPDADKFLFWILEEYEKLRNLSTLKRGSIDA